MMCAPRPRRRTVYRAFCGVVLVFGVCAAAITMPAGAVTPTLASWGRGADAACATANAGIERLVRPTTLAGELRDLRAMVTIGTRENDALAAVPRPRAQTRSIDALLALGGRGIPLIRELITALDRGDSATVTSITDRSAKLNDEYNTMADRLGARTCAANPQPGTAPASKSVLPTA